jgi:hypothetical protein
MRNVSRRVRRVAELGVAAIVVVGTVVVPAAAGAPSATCAAAGEIRVRVVVDFGDAPDAPPGVSDVCVPVADRTTGAELLAARARQLGTPQPRYDGGFLCAIDGVPESGCGRDSGADDYWSYWHGDAGKWTYANTGAATWRLRDGDVEGWRFAGTTAESKATPPRAAATSCPAVTATTIAAPATTIVTRPAPPVATAPTSASAGVATTTSIETTPTTSPGAATGATTTTWTSTTHPAGVENASSTRANDNDGSGRAPVGLLVVAAAIVALGVAAGLRFRRRGDI